MAIKERKSTIKYKENVSKKNRSLNYPKMTEQSAKIEQKLKLISASYQAIEKAANTMYTTGSESGGQIPNDDFGSEILEVKNDAKDRAGYTDNKIRRMKDKLSKDKDADLLRMQREIYKLKQKNQKKKQASKQSKSE